MREPLLSLMIACAVAAAFAENSSDRPKPESMEPDMQTNREIAIFAAGCFWCVEAVFECVPGVVSVVSGYTGGHTPNPTYKQVSTGKTGHAEAVRVEYDPSMVSYSELLDLFWRAHDPTTLNRQGADVGTQYRSAIFYLSEEQKRAAEESRSRWQASGHVKNTIVTEIVPAGEFYPAEDMHQDYFERNSSAPYCRFVIAPKLEKLGLASPDR